MMLPWLGVGVQSPASVPPAQQCWTRDIDTEIPSVRPSVCHVPVFYGSSLTHHHIFFSPIIPVFPTLNICASFRLGHPYWAVEYEVRYVNFAIFDEYPAMWETIEDKVILLLRNGNRKSCALYRTMTFPMTSTDIWRSLWWPIYCCHFVCVCVQLTRDLLAICQCIVYRSVLTGLLVAAVLLAVLTSGAASAATGQSAGDDDDDGSFNCNCLVARQLGLAYHVCDTWLPQFNASQLTTLCRSAASVMWMKCKCQYSLYTSLFTNMVAHKKKIQTYKQKAVYKTH